MLRRKCLVVSVALTFVLSLFVINPARIIAVAATADKGWSGTWEAVPGEIISVTETDGFLDIFGKDSISIYSCTGIIEENSATCYGSGKNHESNLRFIYRSQMKLSADGQAIVENWEIGFSNGKEIKWLKGQANFKRKKPQGK